MWYEQKKQKENREVRRKKKSFFTSPLKYSEHVNATVNESKREDIYQDFQVAFNKFLHKKKKKSSNY